MSTLKRLFATCCLLSLAAASFAQNAPANGEAPSVEPDTQEAVAREIPDHCDGLIDPYNLARERVRFFNAAGKDTELSKDEFEANRTAERPFTRSFDHWKNVKPFDTDGNGTIDWLEADTYRREIRNRMLKQFDANRNGRLQGAERDKANALLDAGKIPPRQRKRQGVANFIMPDEPNDPDVELLQKYDADGDGMLSEEELQAAMRSEQEDWRQQALLRYDTDGDGELSDDERKAMYDDRVKPWQQMRRKLQLKLFDENGDGELSDDERAAEKDFGKQFESLGKEIEQRMLDIDGDGVIQDDEREIAKKEMMVFGVRMMVRMRSWMDADADGAVTADEMSGFQTRMAKSTTQWVMDFADPYDADGDGRLSQAERTEFAGGLADEVRHRMDTQDTNKDGRIDGVELEKVIVTWGQDAGAFPKPTTQPADDDS